MKITLPFLAVILSTAAVTALEVDEEYLSERAEKTAKAKRTEILAELKTLDAHDWAGEYRGLYVSWSLLLAPKSGYSFEWYSCMGPIDRNYGAVDETQDDSRLKITFKSNRVGYRGPMPEKLLVRWGGRRYLVATNEIVGFCNKVNQGEEPRTDIRGYYFLRSGDEKKQAAGWPELPQEYRDYLLKQPVSTSIVAVGKTTTRPSRIKDTFYDTQVTLDAGAEQGLKVGMELLVTRPVVSIHESARITEVADHRASAVMTRFGDEEESPQVGWSLSTQGRYARKTK